MASKNKQYIHLDVREVMKRGRLRIKPLIITPSEGFYPLEKTELNVL